jgi:hypothetical protein
MSLGLDPEEVFWKPKNYISIISINETGSELVSWCLDLSVNQKNSHTFTESVINTLRQSVSSIRLYFAIFPSVIKYAHKVATVYQPKSKAPIYNNLSIFQMKPCTVISRTSYYTGSSVSTMSDYGLDGRDSIRDRGREFFFYSLIPDRLWGPPTLLCNGYRGLLPPG